MHGLEPEDFEHDLTFLFESQWNRFSHRGEPWINWLPVEENCETLVINKDKVSFSRFKIDLLRFGFQCFSMFTGAIMHR